MYFHGLFGRPGMNGLNRLLVDWSIHLLTFISPLRRSRSQTGLFDSASLDDEQGFAFTMAAACLHIKLMMPELRFWPGEMTGCYA